MSDNQTYLYTNQELETLQQENKLKGMAMEFLISKVIQDQNPQTQETIEDIQEDVQEDAENQLQNKYKAKKNFRIENTEKTESWMFIRQYNDYLDHRMIVELDNLEGEKFNLYKQKSKDSFDTGYKKCSNCGITLPKHVCKECGGAKVDNPEKLIKNRGKSKRLKDESQLARKIYQKTGGEKGFFWCNCKEKTTYEVKVGNSRKCQSCKRGNFRKIQIDLPKKGRKVAQNINLESLKKILRKENFISKYPLSDKIQRSRTDVWTSKNSLYLLESKNKEETELTVSDCLQPCHYVKALQKAGVDTKKAGIIYNGAKKEETNDIIQDFNEENNTNVQLVNIKDFLRKNSFKVKKIKIGKDIEGERYGESGDYKINIIKSSEFQERVPIKFVGEAIHG